ncbi:MAG: long-chain-fatty-acid--CoA ligase [Pseudomonadota bacterium]
MMQTIGSMLDVTARNDPGRIAVYFEDQGLSYGDLNREVNKLANGLRSKGIGRGDRVMLFMKNSLMLVVGYFAVLKIGGTVVPLNVMFRGREMSHIGTDTSACAILADDDLWHGECSVRDVLPGLKHVFVHGEVQGSHEETVARIVSDNTESPDVTGGLDDITGILYTSGTTGQPKGATQTHRSILSNVMGCCTRNKFAREDRLLCALPLFNNFAINVVMMSAIASGATMVVVDRFDARKVLDQINRRKCTYFAGTPTMFAYLLREYDPGRDNVESLRVMNTGGAPCPPSLIEEVEQTFNTILLDGYGQTEACGFTTLNPLVGVRRANSVGVPISNIGVRIVSDDDLDLPVGEVGEIVEKGTPFSIHRYWNKPEINSEVYRGGWFHSGDLGYLDDDGYLYVVDRKQDLIITGGANIYPAEIEGILCSHPKVSLAAVVGIPDEVKGELAKAFIVLRKGETAAEEEIIRFVRERAAKYKAPRAVEFVESLPQGPTGKVLKRELRKPYWEGREAKI